MAAVLVFGEVAGGNVSAALLEVASAGAALARSVDQPLDGALVGLDASRAAQELKGGFRAIYVVEDARCAPYTAEAFVAAARAVIAACEPGLVLFSHTAQTREWVPRLAARLDSALVTDCTGIRAENGSVIVSKPVYGGAAHAEYELCGKLCMATLRAGAFEACAGDASSAIRRVEVTEPIDDRVAVIAETACSGAGGRRLKDAKIVVAGGRGIGGAENWHYVEETAATLDAAVGCSRPVADSGWAPSEQQIGLSGTIVAPDLYVAIGISGAVQHLAGIGAAKAVVAINIDPDAEIFNRANYGVVGDYREVLPAFAQRVKQLRT